MILSLPSLSMQVLNCPHFYILLWEQVDISYYSYVFYKLKQPHEWDMHFVIVKDDPAGLLDVSICSFIALVFTSFHIITHYTSFVYCS